MVLINERYQLLEEIGSSLRSEVYLVRDTQLDRTLAIKVLRLNIDSDTDLKTFRMEARAAANLSHPNIVTVHDFGNYGDFPFIVMEHIPGTNLKSMIHERGFLPVGMGISLAIQACAGIGYAHRAGLVHCDVKPQNLLVSRDQRLKVTDFGMARALASYRNDEENSPWGSPHYFSPEQAAGRSPSTSSDVYSLGVVMYEMFTGRLPFRSKRYEALMHMHQTALPQRPIDVNPSIHPLLNEIIMKTLSKEPSARYRSADQLGRVLHNFSNIMT